MSVWAFGYMSSGGSTVSNTGFTIAGAGATTSGEGADNWSDPGDITAEDGVQGAFSSVGKGTNSEYLNATQFGFAIAGGATIKGVEVRIVRKLSAGADVRDHTVQLIIGGSRSGNNNADTDTTWPADFTNADYGDATNLWGNSLTPAIINASTFGVALKIVNDPTSGGGTGVVDAVYINVYYTA